MDTIPRLWRGEVGLARTFWLWYWLIGALLIGSLLQIPGLIIYGETGSRVIYQVGSEISFMIRVFFFVAIWRSADNYTGPQLWFYLARISVVLGAISVLFSLYSIATGHVSGFWADVAHKIAR